MPRFPAEVLFKAFKRAGMLVSVRYRPGTHAERQFDAQWTRPDELVLTDTAQATDYLLEYVRACAPALRKGDPLRVDGVAYVVRAAPMVQGDGTFIRCALDPA